MRFWVRKMDLERRIKLPSEITSLVNWLGEESKGSKQPCVAYPESDQQILIRPIDFDSRMFAHIKESTNQAPLQPGEETSDWFKLARLESFSFETEIDQKNALLKLPKELVELGYGPSSDENLAVLFVTSITIEVWRSSHFKQWLNNSMLDRKFLEKSALSSIEDR